MSYAAASKRDTVYLYNGQVLIGEIQGLENGLLSVNETDLGMLNVKFHKIKKIVSPLQFRVITVYREEYFGSFKASDNNGYVDIVFLTAKFVSVAIIDINTIAPLEKSFFKRLRGNVGMGFTYAKSSGIGQFNFNSTLTHTTKLFQNELYISGIGSIDSSKLSRDNESVQLFSTYNLTPSWFIAGGITYQRNLELSLARRFQELIGGGNKLIVRKNFQLSVVSGITFNQEKSTAGVTSPLLLEIPVMFRFTLYQFSNPNIQINTSQTGHISLSEKGRIRYSGVTSIAWEVFRQFNFTLNPYSNYDSKPSLGGSTFDFGISFGISYKL
jgi:hypothetical protein